MITAGRYFQPYLRDGQWGFMRILDKLERRIGWFSIKNLPIILVAGNAAVWLLGFIFTDNTFITRLVLVPSAVFKGEVWRILTFIFINSFGSSPLSALLELYFLFMVGRNLEASWGSFRLTAYYFIGYALTVIVSLATGYSVAGARYIHLTLFFAFAQLAPEMRLLLFFIIPVKIKWLAWAAWAFTAYEFIMAGSWAGRLFILAPVAAFVLFFWNDIMSAIRYNRGAFGGGRKAGKKSGGPKVIKHYFHKCETCGLTDLDAPEMDFRYCSKCAGNHEYCMNHLNDHYHRTS